MAEIVGRDEELAAIDRFLTRPHPSALLIEGDAGIGKTILWREGVRRAEARGCRALVASPIESERQLPYSALGDLLGDASAEVLDQLPTPQRRALGVALLLDEPEATPPDRRAVAVAVLRAIRLLAVGVTLLMAIDDVQWLDADSQSVLEFLVRRLAEAPIALLFARRREREDEPLPLALDRTLVPVEREEVGGLSIGATSALLRERLDVSFRRPVLHRIQETSGGNPLFVLGLARALAANPQAADRELQLPRSLREVVQERLAPLSAETTDALLAAAALSDPTRTSLELALGPGWQDRLQSALDIGIVDVGAERIRFTHPLLRSVLYADVSAEARRDVHRHLSQLDLPLEERARHLAIATEVPDAATAAVLEEAARSAALRGAPQAAAELASRAVALSDPPDDEGIRRRRYLAAGEYWGAGDVERARAEVEAIVAAAPPGPIRAQALLRLAKNPRDMYESRTLCEQALAEAAEDAALRCDVLLFYAKVEFVTKGAERAHGIAEEAIRVATAIGDEPKRAHAEALGAYLDWVSGRPFDRAALDRGAEFDPGARDLRLSLEERVLYLRAIVLTRIADIDKARESWLALEEIALEAGDESAQADILDGLGRVERLAGNWSAARAYFDAAVELAEQTGLDHVLATNLVDRADFEVWRGDLDAARSDAERALELAGRTHEVITSARAHHAMAVIAEMNGDYDTAADDVAAALAVQEEMGIAGYSESYLSTAVDVALAQRDFERAEELTGRLEAFATSSGLDTLEAASQRCRGLVLAARGDFGGAMAALSGALAARERTAAPFEVGRTLLDLGEVQRRARQRRAARETLGRGLQIFESLGAPMWAERARRAIGRIGGRTKSGDELTPTEQRVAELVAEGRTNKEVAAELVVTVRAVEANLSRIYSKLGIRSRAELARRYRTEDDAVT
jgi:DNA-binding CsgD family transcriptional regulator